MTTFLFRLKVGQRLGGAFGVLIVLTVGLVAAGLLTLSAARDELDSIVTVNIEKTRISETMADANSRIFIALGTLVTTDDPTDRADAIAVIQTQRASYQSAREALEAFPAGDTGRAIRTRIDAARDVSRGFNDQVVALSEVDLAGAQALLNQSARAAMRRWQDAISENASLQRTLTAESYTAASQAMDRGRSLLIAGGVVVLLVSALLGFVITRSLTGPLTAAASVAEAIARGRFDNRIDSSARDETGHLLSSMHRMQEILRGYADAQLDMGARHDAGEIGHRIDVSRFDGSYADMAATTNRLVDSHLRVMDEMAELTQRYAVGDLSNDMRELPGEKARITEAMRATKRNLEAVNAQITVLADAAARGDFSVRGDADQYRYAFRDMVAALNRLMQEADAGISDVGRIMSALADGDLTQRVERQHQGAFGRLADDANATVAQLTGIVSRIQQASGAIGTASSEIAAGNNDLSQRTEQQAANLEETAASMEELTSTVRQNADHARQANQLVIGTAQVASQGGDVVGQVVATMGEIEQSSRRIADIISVIDGIAFQTNILALNAAVEAARAGEQGRGFAVVASEVRTLAQRSAGAAKEIKQLIDDSTGKVESGAALAAQAGKTMSEIVGSVQRVTDIMSEIAAASQEQAAGIEQVNQTITQMDETTQQNAALVEEASAAARAMEEQASALNETVALFRTGNSAAMPTPIARAVERAVASVQAPALSRTPRPSRGTANAASPPASLDTDWSEF